MSFMEEEMGSISERCEFDWVINVSSDKILELEIPYIDSPTFCFSFSSWFIRMHPKGQTSDCREWISLFLRNHELDIEKEVSFSLEMTLHDVRLRKIEIKYYFKRCETGFGYNRFILRETLNSLSKENDGQIMIKIKMNNPAFCVGDTLHRLRRKGREILRQNYRDMLLKSDDQDLVLKVKDKEFKVHRLIMQNRCPVFKRMLSHEMMEKNNGVVEIPDCDPLAFSQFLLHVYTGEISMLSKSTMLGIYYIADKYDIKNLKKACSAFIKKSLTVRVICDVIELALNHSDNPLLEFATNFFVSNAKEIFVTVEWQSFIKQNPIQANELIIKAFEKASCVCNSNDGDEDDENYDESKDLEK